MAGYLARAIRQAELATHQIVDPQNLLLRLPFSAVEPSFRLIEQEDVGFGKSDRQRVGQELCFARRWQFISPPCRGMTRRQRY